jgi:hypothetical protein
MRGGGHAGFLARRSNLLFCRVEYSAKESKLEVFEVIFAQICQSFK